MLGHIASHGIQHVADHGAEHSTGIVGAARKAGGSIFHTSMNAYFIYESTLTEGREYGYGYGFLKGASYSVPYIGTAMMAYDIGKAVGDFAYNNQQAKTRSSFTRGFNDYSGNAATMRQRSQYNLNRGRSALGSEAYLMHY